MKLYDIIKYGLLSVGIVNGLNCPTLPYGYPCCQTTNLIIEVNEIGSWGFENGNWCGIYVNDQVDVNNQVDGSCWSLKLGYPCCTTSTLAIENDSFGSWGYENNHWCGISGTGNPNYQPQEVQPVQPPVQQAPVQAPAQQTIPQPVEQQPQQSFQFQQPFQFGQPQLQTQPQPQPQPQPEQQQPEQQQPEQQQTQVTPTVNSATTPFPKAEKNVSLDSYILVKAGEVYDGLEVNGVWTSYDRGLSNLGDCNDVEGGEKDAVFRLETGATLKNVILGPGSIEHVHCVGDGCTIENVWWDDVCEDALSLKNSEDKNAKFYVIGGGARDGSDKIVQHNSAGTVHIKGFTVKNAGKLYRSCGACKNYNGERHVIIEDVTADNAKVLAGININHGDTATFINVTNNNGKNVCETFISNDDGSGEPTKVGAQCNGQSDCVCK